MKVTKVDKIRIGVSGVKAESVERGMLYRTETTEQRTVEEEIGDRVYRANRMYSVFFAQTYIYALEGHFSALVKLAKTSDGIDDFIKELMQYQGYEHNGHLKEVNRFVYKTKGGSFFNEMELHIRERLCDEWQEECYKQTAMEMLKCICGKVFLYGVEQLDEEILSNFYEISNRIDAPYIKFDTRYLEKNFTEIIKNLEFKLSKQHFHCVEEQIEWLQNLKSISIGPGRWRGIDEMKYSYATEDRMDAILVRMRKSLKKGQNVHVANQLLQGIAQMDGKTLFSVIEQMKSDEKEYKALKYFIESLNKDYHKKDLVKSIENHDVKVQVHDDLLDLSSVNVAKYSAKKKSHKQLNESLVRYASSPENADDVLLKIKEVMLEYFVWNSSKDLKDFLKPARLWDIPKREIQFFDYEFEPIDEKKEEKPEAMITLAELWQQEKVRDCEVRARINYVNCGKYQQMMANTEKLEITEEEMEFRKYWIGYIKDYVERNYVKLDDKKKKQKKRNKSLTKEACCTTKMLSECWKDTIRFICGKYIDIGKAVYHYAMPENMEPTGDKVYGVLNDVYKEGISSFAYESIKAEENLQRIIADSVVTAMAYFAKSVVDVNEHDQLCKEAKQNVKQKKEANKEDILFLSDKEFRRILKSSDIVRKQLLRYYGGQSSVKSNENENIYEEIDGTKLAFELLGHLKAIRNDNFHYTEAKKTHFDADYTKLLWENEIRAYHNETKKKYYTNNLTLFYATEDLKRLYECLYQRNDTAEAFIPSFRTTWKRQDLSEYAKPIIKEYLPDIDDLKQFQFEGALYFLLKEIYYRDFILRKETLQNFYDAVDEYANQFKPENPEEANDKNRKKSREEVAADHFKEYVESYKNDNTVTFGTLSHAILSEGNAKKKEKEGFKHFTILFPRCVRNAFFKYIQENDEYQFLLQPTEMIENVENDFLRDAAVGEIKMEEDQLHWFTFAHFMHPTKLNYLIGDFRGYIQYKKDVFKRAKSTGQMTDEAVFEREKRLLKQSIEKAEAILEVLEFVKNTVGRVSLNFEDYYTDKEEYAKYLSNYIAFKEDQYETSFEAFSAFCQNTLEDGALIDIYFGQKEPKIVPNIELFRMYSSSDVMNLGYEKITEKELIKYYAIKDEVATVMSTVMHKSYDQRKQIVEFQQLKNRITLYEVTAIYSMLNDLLGQLVSLSYLRERDEMYLLLGFYYMALRNKEGWKYEEFDSAEGDNIQIKQGLILYQVVSLFDFGKDMIVKKDDEWTTFAGNKWGAFTREHGEPGKDKEHRKEDMSLIYALRLFQKEEFEDDIKELRNFIDHSKYYRSYEKSILELYNEFYTKFFGYNKKLRKSVLFNLNTVLERYFLDATIIFEDEMTIALGDEFKSQSFTYKYYDERDRVRSMTMPAKTTFFVDCAKALLEYSCA